MSEAYELSSYPACIRDFATYKLGIQGCSKKTVEEYLLDLRMFTRFIYSNRNGLPTDDESMEKLDISSVDDGFFAGITTEEIYDYMYFLKNVRNNTPTSRARKLSAIKSFYKCMTVKYHRFDENPAINIEGPKKKPSLPKFLSTTKASPFFRPSATTRQIPTVSVISPFSFFFSTAACAFPSLPE